MFAHCVGSCVSCWHTRNPTRTYAADFNFPHQFSCSAPFVLRIHLFHRIALHLLRCAAAQYASCVASRVLLYRVTFLSFAASSVIWSSSYQTRWPLLCRSCGAVPPEFSRMPLTQQIRWVKNVLGSGLSTCETNSARQGFILRGVSQSSAPARWRSQRRARHGRHSIRKRHSLASRGRRARQNPDPRTSRLSPKKTPRIRRRQSHRISRRPKKSSLDHVGKINSSQEAISLPARSHKSQAFLNRFWIAAVLFTPSFEGPPLFESKPSGDAATTTSRESTVSYPLAGHARTHSAGR